MEDQGGLGIDAGGWGTEEGQDLPHLVLGVFHKHEQIDPLRGGLVLFRSRVVELGLVIT